ncbi:NAD(P)-dependent oxidoreductase [Amycolatopsis sacchari]|uniref:3-hydroxyisobutyrate dehydrogenase n=1 Tax=Amycolatopsis sacchari TaxID=115433 RepID=A0A1I3UJZ2_9PSEU|nr:NAD(P)-dependent oxidoreductase [Amycolatopsis sacchari]SFJ83838.1 3-hydroxyisobutyrate dehydrogenase [Amycolatopsis sacchari]
MDTARPTVGFIGLGDQGLPMATAIAEAGFALHAWARRPASLRGLRDVPHVRHDSLQELAAACDIVGLCVSTDEDVLNLVTGGLLDGLRPGSVVVNHGTGLPANAVRLTEICAPAGVAVLDAPVSGGRPGAEERRLTTMVGGPRSAADRCEPVFSSFSRHVVHLGEAGAGQMAKLFNNALLMLNQANIAEIVDLAAKAGVDPVRLTGVLKLGSASSAALTLLNTMVTLDVVDHLSAVEALDMELFDAAIRESGVDARPVTERGLAGARGLPGLLRSLNP